LGKNRALVQECLGDMDPSARLRVVPPILIQLRPQLFEQRGVLRSSGFSQKLVNDRHDPNVFVRERRSRRKVVYQPSRGAAYTWLKGNANNSPLCQGQYWHRRAWNV
jgi:hypothetical protein